MARPDATSYRIAKRLVAPGEVRREQDRGSTRIDEPGSADPQRDDVVPRAQLLDDVGDRLLDLLWRGRRCVAQDALQHLPVLVDDAGLDLGAADVDPDRQELQH